MPLTAIIIIIIIIIIIMALERLDTILLFSSLTGRLDDIRSVLDQRANVNATDASEATSLHLASRSGHAHCVELLIERKANLNARAPHWTPLHYASFHGRKECARLLIDHGADTSIKDVCERTTQSWCHSHDDIHRVVESSSY